MAMVTMDIMPNSEDCYLKCQNNFTTFYIRDVTHKAMDSFFIVLVVATQGIA